MNPFSAKQVTEWEVELAKTASKGDADEQELALAVVKGFFLWLVHARGRWTDCAKITREQEMDVENGIGYLECVSRSGEHKTGHAARKLGLLLPMAAHAFGLPGSP